MTNADFEEFERQVLLEVGRYAGEKTDGELQRRQDELEIELVKLRREIKLIGLAIAVREGSRGFYWLTGLYAERSYD